MNIFKLLGLLVCLSLAACQTVTEEHPHPHASLEDVLRVLHAYGINASGMEEDFDAWLTSLEGRDGTSVVDITLLEDGLLKVLTCDGLWHDVGMIPRLQPEFRWQNDALEWRLEGEAWKGLLSLSDLPKGPSGDDGLDGSEVIFEIIDGTLKWQHLGSDTWQTLIDLDTLKGTPGKDGSVLELRIENAWLEWKPLSDHDWQPLLELATLTGPRGPRGFEGATGLSAYELYLKHHPESTLSEAQWAHRLGPQETTQTMFTSVEMLHNHAVYTEEVTFQGSLTHLFEDGYFLSDGTHHIKVINPFHQSFTVGDLIEVTGYYMVQHGHWHLTHLIEETLISRDQGSHQPFVPITHEEFEQLNPYDKLIYGRQYLIQGILDKNGRVMTEDHSVFPLSFPLERLDAQLKETFIKHIGQEVRITFSLNQRMNVKDYETLLFTVEPVRYTVSFVSSLGDTLDPLTLENGLFKDKLPEPIDQGHHFKGWYLDAMLTSPLTSEDRLKDDLILYALWEEVPQVCGYDALSVSEAMQVSLGELITVYGVVTSMHGFENVFYLQDNQGQSIMVGHFNHMPSIKTANVGDCVVVSGERLIQQGQAMIYYASIVEVLSAHHPIMVIDHLTMEDVIEGYHEYVNHRMILKDIMIEAIEGNTVYLRSHQDDGPRLKLDLRYESMWPEDGVFVGTVLSQLEFTLHRAHFGDPWIVDVKVKK